VTETNTPIDPHTESVPSSAQVAPQQSIPQQSTPQPPPPPLSAPGKEPHARTSLGFYFLAFWVLLLSFTVAFGAFWFYQDKQAQIQTLQVRLDEQQTLIVENQRNLQDSLDKELVNQQENLQSSLNLLAEEVNKNSARVMALTSVNRDNWKLAEAQYLLRLANQRILLEKDSQSALALALSADDILSDVEQTQLLAVRKVLAEEIAVLKLAGVVDREGIFLRLAALANQIDAIPFIEALGKGEEDDEQEIPENETVRQMLNRKFYGLLHKLRSYVRVRDHGKTVNAILPPSQQAYLQQNLRLMFEQTQVALLRNDAQIYRESLIKAQNWINQYYTLNQEASAVLAELQILQEENIAPELTNFGNTSSALADYIERQEKQAAARRGGR
jgi:uroporphyrin-3 C-methyltransferase